MAVVQKHHHFYVNSLARLILQLLGTCLPPYSIWQHSTKMISLKYKPDHVIKWLSIIQWLPMIHVTPSKPSPASPHILYHPTPIPSHLIIPHCSLCLWHAQWINSLLFLKNSLRMASFLKFLWLLRDLDASFFHRAPLRSSPVVSLTVFPLPLYPPWGKGSVLNVFILNIHPSV